MTNKIKGFYVVLDKDYRDDDFESIKNSVLMINGVISVKESITNSDDHMNRERIRQEYIQKLWDALQT